jgi:hypothetical protein
MSFTIYIGAFRDHELFDYDPTIVEEVFAPLIATRGSFGWALKVGGFVSIDDAPKINHFSVDRPPGSAAFWVGLVEIMRRTPSVVYWPDEGRTSCVADQALIAHLPPDMVEALGEPFVVSNGEEITNAIKKRRTATDLSEQPSISGGAIDWRSRRARAP